MVDMVNDEVRLGFNYLTMHLKGLASRASGRIKCSKAGYGLPCKLGQPVIIFGIDDSEFSAGKGDPPLCLGTCSKNTARIEIGA